MPDYPLWRNRPVGTNGGPSFYRAFDMSGNVTEWNDFTGAAGSSRGLRGGDWASDAFSVSSSGSGPGDPSGEFNRRGFRLASPVGVPEIDPNGLSAVLGFARRWTGITGTTAVRPLTVPFGLCPFIPLAPLIAT